MSRLSIEPEALDKAGQDIEGTAERFFAAIETFAGIIEGFSDAAGGDEIGGLIGDAHQSVYDLAMECLQETAQSMADAGIDVRDFAAQHLAADDASAQIFAQIQGELKGGA